MAAKSGLRCPASGMPKLRDQDEHSRRSQASEVSAMSRREFAKWAGLGLPALVAAGQSGGFLGNAAEKDWAESIPVLESLKPVLAASRFVQTVPEKIVEHAGYMAYEELPLPEWRGLNMIEEDTERTSMFFFVVNSLNFAFTDFDRHVIFQVSYRGRVWWDADAMTACLCRALDEGRPILDGKFLATISRRDLEEIFRGNVEMPMLDERVKILREVGATLAEKYQGQFHHFLRQGSRRLYDRGEGILERLVREFPSFYDASAYDGKQVIFHKRAQLLLYMLHGRLSARGLFRLEDPERLTAFADYIVPVALRLMGIFRYAPSLEEKINRRQLIPRHSPEEVELRAHSLYATTLLRQEINRRRPPDRQIITPQVDSRLWTHFHATFWPHHLTITTAY